MDNSEVRKYWERNAPGWTHLSRLGYDVTRDYLNTPAFLAMLPDVKGLHGLDVGCGEGSNTRKFAQLGADLFAFDMALTFLRNAEETERKSPVGIRYLAASAERTPFLDAEFDFIVSTMRMMDMAEQVAALREIFRILKPGGFFQFSITHPCTDTPYRRWIKDENGEKKALAVAGYFDDNPGAVEEWSFGMAPPELRDQYPLFQTLRFNLTISQWLNLGVQAGFQFEEAAEPHLDEESAQRYPFLADSRLIPMSILFRWKKPSSRKQ